MDMDSDEEQDTLLFKDLRKQFQKAMTLINTAHLNNVDECQKFLEVNSKKHEFQSIDHINLGSGVGVAIATEHNETLYMAFSRSNDIEYWTKVGSPQNNLFGKSDFGDFVSFILERFVLSLH